MSTTEVQATCIYCERNEVPTKRCGYYWHWDDGKKALTSCTPANAKVLQESIEKDRHKRRYIR